MWKTKAAEIELINLWNF